MTKRFGLTIDCADPTTLADFWRELLDYADDPPPHGYRTWKAYDDSHGISTDGAAEGATIVDPAGIGPRLYFQRVPETKIVKNRLHLDVRSEPGEHSESGDQARSALRIRAEGLGAKFLYSSEDAEDRFLVLADPEGNEFCVT